jgi:hypothetical protein
VTLGTLEQLLPVLVNRKAENLTDTVDLVRRAIKSALVHAYNKHNFKHTEIFADVVVPVTSSPATGGLLYNSFEGTDEEIYKFKSITAVMTVNETTNEYEPIELITKGMKRFSQIMRRPYSTIRFVDDYRCSTWPVAYIYGSKLYIHWFSETTFPTELAVRIEGLEMVSQTFEDIITLDASASLTGWMFSEGENYLIHKSCSFLALYMKEDERHGHYDALAERDLKLLIDNDTDISYGDDGGVDLE